MTKTTKILVKASMVLASFIVLSLSGWADAPKNIPIDPNGTVYRIYTLTHLNELTDYVNNVNNCASNGTPWTSSGKTFILMENISVVTKPIGNPFNPFLGTFDGNGKKITLSMNNAPTIIYLGYLGLFAFTDSAVIKNLTVAGNITAQGSCFCIGGIVAYGNYTTITDCTNLADIYVDNKNAYECDIGGIAGHLNNSSINLCANAGDVTYLSANWGEVGGICGLSYGDNGNSNISNISRCVNIGNIYSAGGSLNFVGGICGEAPYTDIDNCANAGWIKGSNYVGGIIGEFNPHYHTSMQKCLNTGVVQGNNNIFVGSLIGYIEPSFPFDAIISDCYYDKQMCPNMTAVFGKQDNIFTNVQGLNTNELATSEISYALGSEWSIYVPTNGTAYSGVSYPCLIGISDSLKYVAAATVRLALADNVNFVSSTFCMDIDYNNYDPLHFPSVTPKTINWQASRLTLGSPVLLPLILGHQFIYALGPDVRYATNPNSRSGQAELIASIGNYSKTVPINLTGAAFKRNLEESNLGTFTVSELTPNIVTNQAEIDVTVANGGNLNVSIYNLAGSKVMNVFDNFVNENTTTKVDLNNLSDLISGVYTVVITVGNDSAIRKFIKQ